MIRLGPVYRWNENLGFEWNKIVPLRLVSWYLIFILHLSPAVSKKIHICLLGNKGTWLRTLARKTKVSNYKSWREKWNQYIKTKSIRLPFKTKNSNISSCDDFVSSNWIYHSLVKNKSVKLPFVTKNNKHLVRTSGDDSSALIKFTPWWKTVSNYPL